MQFSLQSLDVHSLLQTVKISEKKVSIKMQVKNLKRVTTHLFCALQILATDR